MLFLYAALVPFPNEILIIPLAFTGYRVLYILPPLLVGNGIFNLLAGFGIVSLFGML